MSLRWQILLSAVLLAVVPLAVAIGVIRLGIGDEVSASDTRRVADRMQLVMEDLDRQDTRLATLLEALAGTVTADNRFRLAATGGRDDLRPYLVDYAPRQLALMDIDMLLIQDPQGTVVSSGHFREAAGELDPRLPRVLGRAPGGRALMPVHTTAGSFLALVRTLPFRLADQTWHLTAGLRLDAGRLVELGADPDLSVALAWPGGAPLGTGLVDPELTSEEAVLAREFQLRRAGAIVRTEYLPLLDDGVLGDAWLMVSHDRGSLHRLLQSVNRRLALILVAAAAASILLATLLAGRISRPLRELAARTGDLDLERLDVRFDTGRRDEVGRLARLLDELAGRLRRGVARLREAEHRATLGEVSRQVNHDIRNGITPLRNVLHHLGDVAADDPAALPRVFAERRPTLDEGLRYLEELAGHYARLGGNRAPRPCRLAPVLAALAADHANVTVAVPHDLPPVQADPISLRRIFENLLRNALEAAGPDGTVSVTARAERDPDLDERRVVVAVADDGPGIPPEHLDLIFNDFFTTRQTGTGLGLSNVRRLVADAGGKVGAESTPGEGAVFLVSFPLPDPARSEP